MMAAGWIEETRRLIADGYERILPVSRHWGIEMAAYLRGETGLEEAAEATRQHHRRYAKRQLTWFKADKRIHWIECAETAGADVLAEEVRACFMSGNNPNAGLHPARLITYHQRSTGLSR